MGMMALSWSRLSDYQQCPLKFKLKYIDKNKAFQEDPNEKSPHLVRGENVHRALENYLIKKIEGQNDIPRSSLQEVEDTKPLIDMLLQDYDKVNPELQVCVTREWKQTAWFDTKTAFYRAIIDLYAVRQDHVLILDWKTGKFKDYSPDGPGQLELTAVIMMKLFPQIPKVSTAYIYVDHKKKIVKDFTQADVPRLEEHFVKMSDLVNADTEHKPRSNEFCKYCQATTSMCKYSRKM